MSDGKTWTKNEIRNKLKNHDKWVVRGILAIYKLQTHSERRSKTTHKYNNVGFNSVDAGFLSDLAESAKTSIEKYGRKTANALTDAQMEAGREAIFKYSGQLADIANGEIEERKS
jgi:hypothetical protein